MDSLWCTTIIISISSFSSSPLRLPPLSPLLSPLPRKKAYPFLSSPAHFDSTRGLSPRSHAFLGPCSGSALGIKRSPWIRSSPWSSTYSYRVLADIAGTNLPCPGPPALAGAWHHSPCSSCALAHPRRSTFVSAPSRLVLPWSASLCRAVTQTDRPVSLSRCLRPRRETGISPSFPGTHTPSRRQHHRP